MAGHIAGHGDHFLTTLGLDKLDEADDPGGFFTFAGLETQLAGKGVLSLIDGGGTGLDPADGQGFYARFFDQIHARRLMVAGSWLLPDLELKKAELHSWFGLR